MPPVLPSKRLRALQELESEPPGSKRVERVDVRNISATRRGLAAMVGQV